MSQRDFARLRTKVPMSRFNAYQKTQTSTASKERILVMLLQTALRRMREGADAFDAGERLKGQTAVRKASDIVWELLNTLDAKIAPELAANLTEVYTATNLRLLRAMTLSQSAPLREAERIFEPIVDAFEKAVREMAGKAA